MRRLLECYTQISERRDNSVKVRALYERIRWALASWAANAVTKPERRSVRVIKMLFINKRKSSVKKAAKQLQVSVATIYRDIERSVPVLAAWMYGTDTEGMI